MKLTVWMGSSVAVTVFLLCLGVSVERAYAVPEKGALALATEAPGETPSPVATPEPPSPTGTPRMVPTMTPAPTVTPAPKPSPEPEATPVDDDGGVCGSSQSDDLLRCDGQRSRCTTRIIKRDRLRRRRTLPCELNSCFRAHRVCLGEVSTTCGAPGTIDECYRALQSTICQQCVNQCGRRGTFKGCARDRIAALNIGILSEVCLEAARRLSKEGC